MATLNDSSRTFLDNFEITSIYRTICRLTVTRLGAGGAWIEPPGHEGVEMTPSAIHGLPAEALAVQKMKWERGSPSKAQNACLVETVDDLPAGGAIDLAYHAYAVCPLTFSNRPIGALKMLSKCPDFFSEDKRILIQSYANLAAVAIQNSWFFDEIRMTNRQLHGLSQRLMKAQEHERLNLYRELHDESGQLLAALTVHRHPHPDEQPDAAHRGVPPRGAGALPHIGRHLLLRPQGDQGRHLLPPGGRESRRRRQPPADVNTPRRGIGKTTLEKLNAISRARGLLPAHGDGAGASRSAALAAARRAVRLRGRRR